MSIPSEAIPSPKSVEAQALAELEKEGFTIPGSEKTPEPKEEKPLEEKPKEEPRKAEDEKPEKDENKPDAPERTPRMVESWKLRVAEDQKSKLAEQVADLSKKVEQLSNKDLGEKQKIALEDDIESVIKKAEEGGTDGTFLREFANSILNKVKPSNDVLKTLQEERELEKQLNSYEKEFESDVLPLVKEYNISDEALSKIRSDLRDIAFSETYSKVPLKEIFKIKADAFDLKPAKRSSESKTVKTRASDTIDLDSVTEDDLKNMSPEQIENLVSFKSSNSGWKRNKR